MRLGVVKQSFFGLAGQYGRRVTRANGDELARNLLLPHGQLQNTGLRSQVTGVCFSNIETNLNIR